MKAVSTSLNTAFPILDVKKNFCHTADQLSIMTGI